MAQNIRLQIEKVQKDLVKGISQQIGELAFASYSAIIIASPVDTGHFRHNWQVGLNSRPDGTLEGADKTGQKNISQNRSAFANYQLGTGARANSIFFTNNVPYALRLNEGHSQQAPSGFVQRALRAGLKALDTTGKIFKS